MQTLKMSKERLEKWADSLYAIGKEAEALFGEKFGLDIMNLAKSMYSLLNTQSGSNIDVSIATLTKWRDEIQRLSSSDKPINEEIVRGFLHIERSIEGYLPEKPEMDQLEHIEDVRSVSELLWTSIMLGFTLWYGGQSFSLSNKEISAELGLHKNIQIKSVLETLLRRSIFLERGSGLIVLNPRSKKDVDMAMLFLIALGVNLMSQLNPERGYSTIQTGFLEFSRSHHHPMVSLAENVRSYVSDYCQRVFGKLFTRLQEGKLQPDYSLLRRFLTRLSLYCSVDFVTSNEHEIKMLIDRLKSLNLIILAPSVGEKFILLRSEVMRD